MTVHIPPRAGRLWPLVGLLLLGSLSFIHLTAIPMFEDEGSQLRWIMRILEAQEWLVPLGDGKPLEAWLMVPLVWLGFPPLEVMRGVHVLVGMLGALLVYRLGLQVGDRSLAAASGVLFVVCPFVVYLQRLALSEMLLCTAGVGVLVSARAWMQMPDGRRAMVLAVSLVTAALAKMPVGFLFLETLPLALALMPADERRQLCSGTRIQGLLRAHLPAVLMGLAIALFATVRVHQGHAPGFGLQTVAGHALGQYDNAGLPHPRLLNELSTQLSWAVVVIGGIGLAAAVVLGKWPLRWLIAAGGLPLLAIGFGAQFWYPRYLLFPLPPLIVAAGGGWQCLLARVPRLRHPLSLGLLLLCVALMGSQSARIILDPSAARWSALDRLQYFQGWSSGYGYPEAARFLLRADVPPQVVFSLDGHSACQLQSYLPAHSSLRI